MSKEENEFHDSADFAQVEKFKLLTHFNPISIEINTIGNLEFSIKEKVRIKNDSIVKELNLTERNKSKPKTTKLID